MKIKLNGLRGGLAMRKLTTTAGHLRQGVIQVCSSCGARQPGGQDIAAPCWNCQGKNLEIELRADLPEKGAK